MKTFKRIAFVDFMYAIVVGSAFPLVAPLELSFRFWGMIFLVIVILEDFYLYHSQIAIHDNSKKTISFPALITEVSILLSWYLATIGFPKEKISFLIAFSAFFLFKWIAGFAHWISLKKTLDWRSKRNFTFLIPVIVCLILLFLSKNQKLNHPLIWGSILTAWGLQTFMWWTITNKKKSQKKETQ